MTKKRLEKQVFSSIRNLPASTYDTQRERPSREVALKALILLDQNAYRIKKA
ncbi:hypothetical protein ACFQDM_10630 [Ponticaulis profundi]|uniref:Uncharacterized protein n=1 Tax=Ponticaulis profundi TaxID=2665222 RepID=A0ABW1SAG3_9PROT